MTAGGIALAVVIWAPLLCLMGGLAYTIWQIHKSEEVKV